MTTFPNPNTAAATCSKISPDSQTSSTSSSLPPLHPAHVSSKSHRVKDWFRPGRWMKQRSPYCSSSNQAEGSPLEPHRKELEELAAAARTHKTHRVALLDLSEIKLAAAGEQRICDVLSIALEHEHTAEYLQQEKYRLQVQTKSQQQCLVYSLKRVAPGKDASARSKRKAHKLLIQEASILSKLGGDPANILTLRGLPAYCNTCSPNEFFLLTDRLHPDTLDRRIQQWRQEGVSNVSDWDPYLYGGDDEDTVATPNDDMIPRKTNYAFQIAKALQACHNAGIVVRDLCPQSIGFRADDPHCIQVFDLGKALDTTLLQEEGGNNKPLTLMVGKRRYLAGEIWKTGQYSFKTDVYSWAMIFYEMCMERKPFQGFTVEEHQKYVWEKGDRPLLDSYYLPEGIDKLLMRAWAHRPEERLTTDQVCHTTQTLLMNLDSCMFWDQGDEDFLFDVFTKSDDLDDDEVSELGDDLDKEQEESISQVEGIFGQSDAHLSIPEAMYDSSYDKLSRESSFTTKQIKLISSAA